MANTIFKIELTSNTMSQLIAGVRKQGSRQWAGRVLAKASLISQDIGTMLVRVFNNTDVAKSLRGQGSEDLPAHFGLNDSIANSLADGMGDLIRSSVQLLSISEGNVISIRIQAVERDWGKYLSLPGATYLARPSNILIPVVKWMLIDPNIDVGAAAYDIVFEGEGAGFDTRIQRVSRSGRAIMVSLDTLGGSGGYVLPSIISGGMGENFIELTLGQKNVARQAAMILMKRVK